MLLLSLRPRTETLWHSEDTGEKEGMRRDEGGKTTHKWIDRERLKEKREKCRRDPDKNIESSD